MAESQCRPESTEAPVNVECVGFGLNHHMTVLAAAARRGNGEQSDNHDRDRNSYRRLPLDELPIEPKRQERESNRRDDREKHQFDEEHDEVVLAIADLPHIAPPVKEVDGLNSSRNRAD